MDTFTDKRLTQLAGEASFTRGLNYFHEGRVQLRQSDANGFKGAAEGGEIYRLRLWREAGEWAWTCNCPAGGFCKHLVAAVMMWRHGPREPASPRDELKAFLKTQPAERLADWPHELADDNPDIEKRLNQRAEDNDPAQLKKSLGAMLSGSGLWDWRRNDEYARGLDAALRLLEDLRASDPVQCLALCGYAIGRLLRAYERSDDSSGALGERIRDFADLHRRVAPFGVTDRKTFARDLFLRQQADDWDFFPLEDYWEVLGEDGQAHYANLVETEYAKLPVKSAAGLVGTRSGGEFGALRRMEKLAGVRRDFDTLQRVLTRDLSSGYAFKQMVLACRDFGREREALQWAERGVKAHADFPGLRVLLAEELQRAGMTEEAAEALWQDFRRNSGEEEWLRMKKAAGPRWAQHRLRALEYLQKREPQDDDGRSDVTLRIELLLADGDLETARALMKAGRAHPASMERLALAIEKRFPADAADFLWRVVEFELPDSITKHYARQVAHIVRAVRLAPGPESLKRLNKIKTQYRARSKLMALLAERGL